MTAVGPDTPVRVALDHDRGFGATDCIVQRSKINNRFGDYALVSSDFIEIYDGGNGCEQPQKVWSGDKAALEQAIKDHNENVYASDLSNILAGAKGRL